VVDPRAVDPSEALRDLPDYVAGSKGGPWYSAHTYPTKVPPETIVPFIEASTRPGGIVADPFCGSGMTGVAALLAGRRAALSDLSPGAVHIARNATRRVDRSQLVDALAKMDHSWMRGLERDLYSTEITSESGNRRGLARHTVWSEVYPCPSCSQSFVLWDHIQPDRPLPRRVRCVACSQEFDRTSVRPTASIPRWQSVEPDGGGRLVHGEPTTPSVRRMDEIWATPLDRWVPDAPIAPTREMYIRSALHLRGVETVADMYARRPSLALSRLWEEIQEITQAATREALAFAFTNTAWHSSRMRRYNAHGGQRPLTGTLFIPQLVSEPNVFEVFRHQVRQICRLYAVLPEGQADVIQGSATDLHWLADGSVDYVFTDPPFGNNIHYADCNIVWESWLGAPTDNEQEIVVNKSRRAEDGGKSVTDYQHLLTAAFREAKRVVKPQGRVSVVFHNSDDAVWSALLQATEDAGLRQASVAILDKGQRSQKGYKARRGELVPFYDLVMTFSQTGAPMPRRSGAGDFAVDVVRRHLSELPANDSPKRQLDYLYSLAVGAVIRDNVRPDGLSLRAFETRCDAAFRRVGNSYFTDSPASG